VILKPYLLALSLTILASQAFATDTAKPNPMSAKVSKAIARALLQSHGDDFNVAEVDASGNVVPGTEVSTVEARPLRDLNLRALPVIWGSEGQLSPVVEVDGKYYSAFMIKGGRHKRPKYPKHRRERFETCHNGKDHFVWAGILAGAGAGTHYLIKKAKIGEKGLKPWLHAGTAASMDLAVVYNVIRGIQGHSGCEVSYGK
jgi:hypothetical protein